MYGSTTAAYSERTAFRRAEKRYKLPKPPSLKSRKKHRNCPIPSTDLSDVVDFESVLRSHQNGEELPPGIHHFHWPISPHPVFCFRDRPGFYFVPGALSVEEQCHWVRESLMSFPQPPNRTNHTAIYGPVHDLLSAVQGRKVLVEVECSVAELGHEQSASRRNLEPCRYMFSENSSSVESGRYCKPIPASVLLRKLRWSTLGLQFDWGKRNYDISLPHNKIPDALCLLSKKMAACAMPTGEEFQPEAAIVNYYGPSDMLGGHVDDMEADWSKPIVSISLGCKAIFLLGGKSREDLPLSMFLRGGDIVLMAGQARECYHGVPRIFSDEGNADVSSLLLKLYREDYLDIMEYMKTSRINISIRQHFYYHKWLWLCQMRNTAESRNDQTLIH